MYNNNKMIIWRSTRLYNAQFGFRGGKSIADNVSYLSHMVYEILDADEVAVCVLGPLEGV